MNTSSRCVVRVTGKDEYAQSDMNVQGEPDEDAMAMGPYCSRSKWGCELLCALSCD